jgi:FkbM family methyltransferase
MKALVRNSIERFVRRFDYRLIDAKADPSGLTQACSRLKARGFMPRTVLDVGVGPGTPWLYASFPDARFELFEALESFKPAIDEATRGLDAVVHYCALGDAPSTTSIRVDTDRPTSSTMAGCYSDDYIRAIRAGNAQSRTIERQVTVRVLDDFGPFVGPTLLKLDVEGYEGYVLKGATRTLAAVDVVISEVSVARRTTAELTLGALISLLEARGFSAMNIAEITHMGSGGPIAYMDMVFVRSDSGLRLG